MTDIMDRAMQEQRLQNRVSNWERLMLPRYVTEHGQEIGVAKLREQRDAFLKQVREQQPKPPGTTTPAQQQQQSTSTPSYNSSLMGTGAGTTYTAGSGGVLQGGATGGGYSLAASGTGSGAGATGGITGWGAAGGGSAAGAGAGGAGAAGGGTAAGGGAAAGGAGAGAGGAGAGAGAGGAGAGGGGGALAGLGPIGLFAAMIAGGKLLEERNSQSPLGRGLYSGLGPSFNQAMADPKTSHTTMAGGAAFGGWTRNKESSEAKPEWAELAEGKTPSGINELTTGRFLKGLYTSYPGQSIIEQIFG